MCYEIHDFYCINCGQKGIPIPRKSGRKREKAHLKKLYCVNCHCDVNHIEIRNFSELEEFKEDYENGKYKELAEESLRACGYSSVGQEHMGR